MASERESFWQDHDSFVVVGHSGRRAFPKLTYKGLKNAGKTVYAVDADGTQVEGDTPYPDLSALPAEVDAAVLELFPMTKRPSGCGGSPRPASEQSGSISRRTPRKPCGSPMSLASRSAMGPVRSCT